MSVLIHARRIDALLPILGTGRVAFSNEVDCPAMHGGEGVTG